MDEYSYTYTARDGACKYNPNATTGIVSYGYVNVASQDVNQMKAALAIKPLSVSIEADQPSFQSYRGGIFNGACGTSLDHATNVVGWGAENGVEYWIMRNSWGTSWGEQGYMRLQIVNGAGVCGIQLAALYPNTN